MDQTINLWPLLGIAAVIAGFLLRGNPLLVVCCAGIVTGAAAGLAPQDILAKVGEGFLKTRGLSAALLLALLVVGLAERHGLRERAYRWIQGIGDATAGGLLIVYLLARQLSAALGLSSQGGQAQVVRPILAPMAEGAWEKLHGKLEAAQRMRLRAMCAATDNVGLFFGENLFVAFSAVILMHAFLRESGHPLDPLYLALWGVPTAMFAFLIHAGRLAWQEYRRNGGARAKGGD
ncbi:DUF969 domain-containing protein [Chromobacterium phragmitis]|uniref:DUF969 domain-containing protein n=1 Tax=Chromobacterium phragmitis TaxID=2202141 RepID=A0A344UF61_9NEIS|nr:DUF969 domain-containing protein [Chromobacterium phragmitis]AXE28585.1 DUF969 domain-containing protein [Chromobacterium phragmitis]AXE33909.1 DUF969 domain-containing protein [Chromobacterium phragmitis]